MVEDDTSGDYKNVLIGIINADAAPTPAPTTTKDRLESSHSPSLHSIIAVTYYEEN